MVFNLKQKISRVTGAATLSITTLDPMTHSIVTLGITAKRYCRMSQ